MHHEFDAAFAIGDLVTLRGMADLNPARCQAFRVEGIHFVEDACGRAVAYKLRQIDPASRGEKPMYTSCDRYVFGGYGLPESELCELPEESRKTYRVGQ